MTTLMTRPAQHRRFTIDDLDDAARRIVHRHEGAGPDGYAGVRQSGPGDRLLPRYAPEAFAFALNELAEL